MRLKDQFPGQPSCKLTHSNGAVLYTGTLSDLLEEMKKEGAGSIRGNLEIRNCEASSLPNVEGHLILSNVRLITEEPFTVTGHFSAYNSEIFLPEGTCILSNDEREGSVSLSNCTVYNWPESLRRLAGRAEFHDCHLPDELSSKDLNVSSLEIVNCKGLKQVAAGTVQSRYSVHIENCLALLRVCNESLTRGEGSFTPCSVRIRWCPKLEAVAKRIEVGGLVTVEESGSGPFTYPEHANCGHGSMILGRRFNPPCANVEKSGTGFDPTKGRFSAGVIMRGR